MIGERFALEHYQRQGFELIAANARTRHGELDLIVARSHLIVFAEVKTRRGVRSDPVESFTPRKARQVRRMAACWLAASDTRRGWRATRLDAVAVRVAADGQLLELRCLEGAL